MSAAGSIRRARLPRLLLPVLGSVPLLLSGSCGRGPVLAEHAALDSQPRTIHFAQPVHVQDGPLALGLEFERPGDSRLAGDLLLVLLDDAGGGDTLRAEADRTGEAAVALRGEAVPGKTYVAARIQAPSPIGLRCLRLLPEPGADHP